MQSMTAFPFTSVLTYDELGWPQLDRAVGSETLRKVLQNYYNNGVFATNDSTCLQVTAPVGGASTIQVKPGNCLINGATGFIEETASLDLTAGDTTLPRIDTVVARLNDNSDYRNIYLDVIIGTPASTPVAPALTQTDSIWEIGLANIYRAANSTVVTNANITDTRADSSRCGYVTAIAELDTESLMQQLNAYYDEFVEHCEDDYDTSREEYLAQCNLILAAVQAFETSTEADILEWFDHIKGQISEDAAVHLQEEIDDAAELAFKRYYGLANRVTAFTRNADGSLATCTSTNSDEDVISVSTFVRGSDGSINSVSTVVTPDEGNFYYTQVATFTRNADGSLASVSEAYTSTPKS